MKLLLTVVAAALVSPVAGDVDPPGPLNPAPAPVYRIDLALEPEDRWRGAIDDLVGRLGYDATFGVYSDFLDGLIGLDTAEELEPLLDHVANERFPDDFRREIDGISRAVADLGFGDRMPKSYILLANLLYETTVFCTSIVARQPDGTILHGRNLDYGIDGMENTSIEVHWVNSTVDEDQTLYAGATFLGAVGVVNGYVPGGFSVSFNERDWGMADEYFLNVTRPKQELRDLVGYLHNLREGRHGAHASMMFLRSTLASQVDYSSALATLTTSALVSPLYFIVGGLSNNEGAVVTRWSEHAQVWSLDDSAWYRLQTNYDHWKPPPSSDDRRTPGNANMQAVGPSDISLSSLYWVLSQVPTLNDITRFTCVMSASLEYFNTTARFPVLA